MPDLVEGFEPSSVNPAAGRRHPAASQSRASVSAREGRDCSSMKVHVTQKGNGDLDGEGHYGAPVRVAGQIEQIQSVRPSGRFQHDLSLGHPGGHRNDGQVPAWEGTRGAHWADVKLEGYGSPNGLEKTEFQKNWIYGSPNGLEKTEFQKNWIPAGQRGKEVDGAPVSKTSVARNEVLCDVYSPTFQLGAAWARLLRLKRINLYLQNYRKRKRNDN